MSRVATPSQPPSTALKVLGICLVAGGGLTWLVVFALFAFHVPRFEEIFQKFDIRGGLPALTQVLIAASHFVKTWWYVLFLAGVLAMGVLVYANLVCRSRAGLYAAAVFATLSLLAALVAIPLVVIGMSVSMVHLVETIGGAR